MFLFFPMSLSYNNQIAVKNEEKKLLHKFQTISKSAKLFWKLVEFDRFFDCQMENSLIYRHDSVWWPAEVPARQVGCRRSCRAFCSSGSASAPRSSACSGLSGHQGGSLYGWILDNNQISIQKM